MTTKFDHIKLGRGLRDHVKSELKGLAGWPAYMAAHGLAGRSNLMTTPDIRAACEALGYDLNAAFVAWFSNPANVAAFTPAPGGGMSLAPMAAISAERANDSDSDEMDTEAASAANEGIEHMTGDTNAFEGGDVDTLLAEALAPASAHMTPHLAALMPGVLRPFIEAAVKPARVVTQTVTVQVGEDGQASAPVAPPACRVTHSVALWQAFGGRRSDAPGVYRHAWENITVDICDSPDAPAVDSDYLWSPAALCEIAAQDKAGLNAWVFGPAGIGKTVGIEQYAARLGRPFVRIAIERTTEPAELIGQPVPAKEGGMTWQDGKLTRAFRIPRAVILIDEPSLLRSGTLAVIMTALDTRAIHTVTGETVRAAPGVFIVAADNTAGNGDDSGRYVDTAPLSAAFMDRFALRTEFAYLPASQEASMIAAKTGVPVQAARRMVDYAGLTRSDCDKGRLTMGVTPRRLLAWARVAKAGIASERAFQSAIVASASAEDREALIVLSQTSLTSEHKTIDGLIRGTIDPHATPADAVQGGVGMTALQFPDDGEAA